MIYVKMEYPKIIDLLDTKSDMPMPKFDIY